MWQGGPQQQVVSMEGGCPGGPQAAAQAVLPSQHNSEWFSATGGQPVGSAAPVAAPLPGVGYGFSPVGNALQWGTGLQYSNTQVNVAAQPQVAPARVDGAWQPGTSAAAMAAMGAPGPPPHDPYANVRVPSAADRAAMAREKNRLAQRKFREKERRRLEEAEQATESLAAELAALRLEKEQLQMEHTLMEKTLLVRNAMLKVVKTLDPSDRELLQRATAEVNGGDDGASAPPDPAAVREASTLLAAAIGDMPSMQQLDELASPLGQHSGSGGAGGSAAVQAAGYAALQDACVGESGAVGAGAAQLPAAVLVAGEGGSVTGVGWEATPLAHVAAAASGAQRSAGYPRALNVQMPLRDNPTVKAMVLHFEHEQLHAYWRDWQQRITAAYRAAEATDFQDESAVLRLQTTIADMAQVFWHVGELRPKLFNTFVLAGLPPPGTDLSDKWRRIAEQSLPRLAGGEIVHLRRAFYTMMKRSAIAAVTARPWVQRLQALAAAAGTGVGGLAGLSQWHKQIGEISAQLERACHEQFEASISFLVDMFEHTNSVLRSFWHVASYPYIPEHAIIVGEILKMHQQHTQQAQRARVHEGQQAPGQQVPQAPA